jgi:2-keto-4-pentenoate hydratase
MADGPTDRAEPTTPEPTERLHFRQWDAADAEFLLDMYSRPDVYAYLGADPQPVRDLDEARERIAHRRSRCQGFAGVWAIDLDDGTTIGTALLVPLPRSDGQESTAFEIGWHLLPEHWGHGYATESGFAMIEQAQAAGLAEVRAVVYPANVRSRAVCHRLGMSEVGLTREWYGVELVEYRLDLAAPASPAVLAMRIAAARSQHRLLRAPTHHGLSSDDAYRAQALVLAKRMTAGRGGWKLGYTSEVMRRQMGVHEPNFGPLATSMLLSSGATVSEGVTQPRAEAELAAVLGADVPPKADLATIGGSVREWRLALEIVDSVWRDYRFDWALNTADGSSAAFVVLGDPVRPTPGQSLADVEVTLSRNGVEVAVGRADAAMGDPLEALAWLARRLAERGEQLRAGDVVITGGLTPAVPLEVGDHIAASSGPALVRVTRAEAL